jgi:hypothetical protein
VFVAAIWRWAPRLGGELAARLYEPLPAVREETPRVERTGWLPPLFPGSFTGYCHRPGQLRAELREAGLEVVDLVGVEGLAFALGDLDRRLDDPVGRPSCSTPPGPSSACPSCSGSGPTCWRRPGGRRADRSAPAGGGHGAVPSRRATSAQAGEAGSITAIWSTPGSSTSSTGSPAAAAAAA